MTKERKSSAVGMNRRQRRQLAKDKEFQKEAVSIVRIHFHDEVDAERLYRDGYLESIKRGTGEIHVSLTKDGYQKQMFSCLPLNSAYKLIHTLAEEWAKGFMEDVRKTIAEEEMTEEEKAATKEAEIAAIRTAEKEERLHMLERLRNIRRQILDPGERQRWIDDLDADIAALEKQNTDNVDTSKECAQNDSTLS